MQLIFVKKKFRIFDQNYRGKIVRICLKMSQEKPNDDNKDTTPKGKKININEISLKMESV